MTNEQIEAALQFLIGTRYVPTVKAYISELTGRKLVIGPGDFSTKDINPDRINIITEDGEVIVGFAFI